MKQARPSPTELIDKCYESIEKHNSSLNSLITVRPKKDVLNELKKADKSAVLYGLPYVMKDAYVTKGIRTTAASKILDTYIPPYNATVYTKLQQAGAILIGKANMDAWGHGASTENTDYGIGKNPWDTSRAVGGSSGGCASAVATGMSSFAIGEDTGGSIRQPSAWNNITGLKVTYGRVSRYGAIAYASSFDTVGPMGRSAEDCAHVLQAIAGVDPYDATTATDPVDDYLGQLVKPIKGMTIGIPYDMLGEGLDPEIKASVLAAAEVFKKLGVKIVEVSFPIAEVSLATYYLIAPSETSSNLARYDGVRYGGGRDLFTPEAKRRIMIGTFALSAGYYDAYYRKAQKVRTLLVDAYARAHKMCDAFLIPTTPTTATKIGELLGNPLANMLADLYTNTVNQTGVPALALPCGFSQSGLPIGMQLVGPRLGEAIVLQLGYHYQQATDWHTRSPKL